MGEKKRPAWQALLASFAAGALASFVLAVRPFIMPHGSAGLHAWAFSVGVFALVSFIVFVGSQKPPSPPSTRGDMGGYD